MRTIGIFFGCLIGAMLIGWMVGLRPQAIAASYVIVWIAGLGITSKK